MDVVFHHCSHKTFERPDWKIQRLTSSNHSINSRYVCICKLYHSVLWVMSLWGEEADVMKCQLKDLHIFTCPSVLLFLRSLDMLASALFFLSAMRFHTVSFIGHKLDNWFASLFIFRFEWHSREFFQLSWSHLYFLLCLPRCRWGIWRYRGISKGGHITQHFYPSSIGTAAVPWFLFLFIPPPLPSCKEPSQLIYHPLSLSLSLYLNLTLLLEGKGRMKGK